MVRFPSLHNFASGCLASSRIWYSSPIADPEVFSARVTKYFTPLFAPGVSLNSKERSNTLYLSFVMISPPLVDSPPSDFWTFMIPSLMAQPFSGKLSPFTLLHPSEFLPLNRSVVPFFCSVGLNELGVRFTIYWPFG